MRLTYRAAHPEDLPECLEVFHDSVSDMRLRHNLGAASPVSPWRMEMMRHYLATGFFHVAQGEGRIVGFASAILRQHLWFLCGFWVRPGWQQQHVGMPLLRSVMQDGRQAGAGTFFVWSSIDLPAMAAYLKSGMLPGTQILMLEGLPRLSAPLSDYAAAPLSPEVASALDEDVLGIRREMDHALLQRLGWQARQVVHRGTPVGYYYVHDGAVAPAAWTEARHAAGVLTLACREASEDMPAQIMVPGMNHDALRFGFESGLRLTGFAHLLTSAPFGHLERYLPSGPGLF
jgi:hypothetical protein